MGIYRERDAAVDGSCVYADQCDQTEFIAAGIGDRRTSRGPGSAYQHRCCCCRRRRARKTRKMQHALDLRVPIGRTVSHIHVGGVRPTVRPSVGQFSTNSDAGDSGTNERRNEAAMTDRQTTTRRTNAV